MALTAAERQRRYEAHKRGDHSLCDPARDCLGQAPPPQRPQMEMGARVPPAPAGPLEFGPRGQELWEAMSGAEMGPAHRVLLVEACRLVDRLDRFDRVLDKGYWLFERRDEDAGRVEIVIDAVLSEARQYASALKAIVAQLEERPKAPAAAPPRKGGGAGLSELTRRIENRKRAG